MKPKKPKPPKPPDPEQRPSPEWHLATFELTEPDGFCVSWWEVPGAEHEVWICSCPDFTTVRPSKGINPLVDPCKHVALRKLERAARFCETDPEIFFPFAEPASDPGLKEAAAPSQGDTQDPPRTT